MSEHRVADFAECSSVVEGSDVAVTEAVSLLEACHNAQPDPSGLLLPLVFGLLIGAYTFWWFDRRGVVDAIHDELRDDDLSDRAREVTDD
jgi:hypothetical protein